MVLRNRHQPRVEDPTMPIKKSTSSKDKLRSRAEKIFLKKRKMTSRKPAAGDPKKLTHELEVHQIELEMQNEELRSKQIEIEEARDRYLDLYDFAPVGYFTFDKKGKIVEVNLTGASLLGLPRARLIGMSFTHFLESDFINPFYAHLKRAFSSEVAETVELRIIPRGRKSVAYISLHSLGRRSAATDITQRKSDEENLLKARQKLLETNERLRKLSDRLLKVQEEERRRIALEVHDSFAASLSAIRHKLQDVPPELKKQYDLEEVVNQLEAAVGEARRIQASLRPPALDDLGIGPALNWFLREFQKTYPLINIEKTFQFGEAEIPDAIKTAIFRITEEALNNIGRHSKANYVSLSLGKNDHSIDLMIRDDGQGFDVERTLSIENSRWILGLSSMKERSALSGGSFRIESEIGKGTAVRVSWPMIKES